MDTQDDARLPGAAPQERPAMRREGEGMKGFDAAPFADASGDAADSRAGADATVDDDDDPYRVRPAAIIRAVVALICCAAMSVGIAACTIGTSPQTPTTPAVSITASPSPTSDKPTPTPVPTRAANGTGGYLAGLIDWTDIEESTEPLHFMGDSDGAIDLKALGEAGHVSAVRGKAVTGDAGSTFGDVLSGTGEWAAGFDGANDTVAVDGVAFGVSLPAVSGDDTQATDYATVFAAKDYSVQSSSSATLADVMAALDIADYDSDTPDGPMRAIAARYGRPSIAEAAYSGSLMTYWWTREGYSFGIRTYELSEMGRVEYLGFVYAPDPLDSSPLTKQFTSLVSGAQSQGLKSFNEFLDTEG